MTSKFSRATHERYPIYGAVSSTTGIDIAGYQTRNRFGQSACFTTSVKYLTAHDRNIARQCARRVYLAAAQHCSDGNARGTTEREMASIGRRQHTIRLDSFRNCSHNLNPRWPSRPRDCAVTQTTAGVITQGKKYASCRR